MWRVRVRCGWSRPAAEPHIEHSPAPLKAVAPPGLKVAAAAPLRESPHPAVKSHPLLTAARISGKRLAVPGAARRRPAYVRAAP